MLIDYLHIGQTLVYRKYTIICLPSDGCIASGDMCHQVYKPKTHHMMVLNQCEVVSGDQKSEFREYVVEISKGWSIY